MSSAAAVLRFPFISPALLCQEDIDFTRAIKQLAEDHTRLTPQDIMKFLLVTLILAVLAVTSSAVATQKAVIVSYPRDAPDSIMSEAMDAIREAGGVITHEYTLFKGFAAKASAKVLENVAALGQKYPPLIEDDQMVSIDGDIVAEKSS